MIHKKIITMMVIATVVMLVGFFMIPTGCGKKAEEKTPAKVEETQKPAATEAQPTKAWTDDEFVEYWALVTYLGEKYKDNPMKAAEEMEQMFKKMGLTSEEWTDRFEAWSEEWTKKIQADPQKFTQEWAKLQEKMAKRLEELKKGK